MSPPLIHHFKTFALFWERKPALLLALGALMGALLALYPSFWSVLSLTCLVVIAHTKRFPVLAIAFLFYLYTAILFPTPNPSAQKGIARIQITEMGRRPTHYGSHVELKGKLLDFVGADHTHQGYGVALRIYGKGLDKLKGDQILCKGELVHTPNGFSFYKLHRIIEESGSNRSAQKYTLKQRLLKFLKKHAPGKDAPYLIYALLTGESQSMRIQMLFNRLGLSHLLAISGFHFAVVILFLSWLLRAIDVRITSAILLLIATAVFVFLGDFASVKRAYLMLFIVLIGRMFELPTNGLNTLGGCLLILLIYNPRIVGQLGFQMSGCATFSILSLFRPIEELLAKVMLRRTTAEAMALNRLSRLAYFMNTMFRKMLAINLSATALTLPIILHSFGEFPLLGIYYNLFVPQLIACLLIASLLSFLYPPSFALAGWFASALLTGLSNFPVSLDYRFSIPAYGIGGCTLTLLAIGVFAIWLEGARLMKQRNSCPNLVQRIAFKT